MSNLRQTRRSLPIALLRARETVMEPIRDMLAASGVNEQKWRILRILEEQGPMELSLLARDACLILSSLTRMVGPLQADGLVTRSTPPDDRRKSVLAITLKGRDLITAHSDRSAGIFAQIETAYGKDRLEDLLDMLEDLQKIDLARGKND